MSFAEKAANFCKRNVVVLTVVPLLVGVHWTWLRLQEVPYLARPEEKKELPIVLGAKKLWEYVAAEKDVDESTENR